MIFGAMPIPAGELEASSHARFVAFLFFMFVYLSAVAAVKPLFTGWLETTWAKLL